MSICENSQARLRCTGWFPASDFCLAWDLKRKINVLWQKPIKTGHGSPLVIGDLVIVVAEPFTVYGLDKMTGEERWRRDVDYIKLRLPEISKTTEPLWKEYWADPKPDNKALGRLRRIYKEQVGFTIGLKGWGHGGPMMPTPVTDGKRLWVPLSAEVLGDKPVALDVYHHFDRKQIVIHLISQLTDLTVGVAFSDPR